jgi:hypothetical protein
VFNSIVLAPKITKVAVEYTAKGQRVTKEFADNGTARRFYAAKLKAGASPKVVAAKLS